MTANSGVRIVSDSWGERHHEFEQADGSGVRCAGVGFCRECNRAADARKAKRMSK